MYIKTKLDKIIATPFPAPPPRTLWFSTKGFGEGKPFKHINEGNFIVTLVPLINKEISESHGLGYYKVILNERSQNPLGKLDLFPDLYIIILAFTTAYARVHMHQLNLNILSNNGKIYYSDTDSIATDLSLGPPLTLPSLPSPFPFSRPRPFFWEGEGFGGE